MRDGGTGLNALLLLLLDSRSPAGGHNHSAGVEAAIEAGFVRGVGDVEAFCRTRLHTSGRVNAAFAAAACHLAIDGRDGWDELDAEFDARTPSAATRAASRQLGRGLMRLVRASLPDFAAPWPTTTPHHPLVLGAAVAAAGGDPELAARAAALAAASVPASGAVRLLGLDPFAAHSVLARLAPDIDALAADVTHHPALPTESAPALDLLADFHLTAEVRLFAS
ncbi:urease accessory protein UreF [uncultured Jatrophihabitans sp.]|uniref:urease accessory protein UreF n=1 Tax=uncultured Jatrophihabitans sp. TaxID=1610747 RepID=UPI0035CB7275